MLSITNYKDKIYLLEKTWTGHKTVAVDNWPNGATERDSGDRETVPADQGGAVVPDGVSVHEIERPETHLVIGVILLRNTVPNVVEITL